MGGIFGGGPKAPAGPTKEELEAQDKREQRVTAKENEEKRKLASRAISRTGRGRINRTLMSGLATGVTPPQRTLGPGRNPRDNA